MTTSSRTKLDEECTVVESLAGFVRRLQKEEMVKNVTLAESLVGMASEDPERGNGFPDQVRTTNPKNFMI